MSARRRFRPQSRSLRASVVVLSLLGTTAVAGGCAGPRPATVLVLHVSNELGRPIAEIRRKACDETEAQFTPVEASRIEPGRTLGVELPPTCVDVVAVDGRGRIVGEQRELEMLPGATWVLRR